MKIIQQPSKLVSSLMGQQPYREDIVYRPCHYTVRKRIKSGLLLYHTLTTCMVLLSQEEEENLLTNAQMAERWFIVPENYDEQQTCKEIRRIATQLQVKETTPPNSYIVFTTTDCNARCAYCLEHGITRKHMSAPTAADVAQYIIRHNAGQEVSIEWFGGEPLYNASVIDIICTALKDAGITFTSTMISNGYLFTNEIIEKAKNLWHLAGVQITIDGTHDIYNRTKRFIYPQTDAYERVMGNIESIIRAEIHVGIRMNVTLKNLENHFVLIKELMQRFPDQRYISMYAQPTMHINKDGDATFGTDEASREQIMQEMERLTTQIAKRGYYRPEPVSDSFRTCCCMADGDRSLAILPDGQFIKCKERYDIPVGTIYQEKLDNSALQAFKETMPDIPECNTCPLYPSCIRLKLCVDLRVCYPSRRDSFVRDLQRSMMYTYWIYKNKEKENQTT